MEIAQFVYKLQMTLNSLKYLLKLSTWLEVERQISNNQIHLHVRVAPLKIRCTMSNWVSYLYVVFWIAMSCTTATLIRSRIPSQRTHSLTPAYTLGKGMDRAIMKTIWNSHKLIMKKMRSNRERRQMLRANIYESLFRVIGHNDVVTVHTCVLPLPAVGFPDSPNLLLRARPACVPRHLVYRYFRGVSVH
jgi:hypothetical protein